MAKVTRKTKTLKIGVTEIVLRLGNKRTRSDYRAAQFFQVRLQNNKLSKFYKFPVELKTAKQKRFYLITQLAQAFIKKAESAKKAQLKREEKARREGREYKPRRSLKKMDVKSFLGADNKTMEELGLFSPEIAETIKKRDEEEVVPDAEYAKKFESFQKLIRHLYKTRIGVFPVETIDPYSTGRPIPVDKNGIPIRNWYDDQVELGLITQDKKGKINGKGSIRWTISRYLRTFLNQERIKTLARASGRKKELIFNIAFITNLAKHRDDKYPLEVQKKGVLRFPITLKKKTFKELQNELQVYATFLLLQTLYGTGDYQDQRLTSTDTYFRVKLKQKSASGATLIPIQNFRLAFSIFLIKAS
jgi:hypothetical protein